jgi:N-acyl-D-aspartate/D-glutamate deacylase
LALPKHLNIIDYHRLRLHAPTVVHDLPAGGRRIVQRADGYVATFVNGIATPTVTDRRQARCPAASYAAPSRTRPA